MAAAIPEHQKYVINFKSRGIFAVPDPEIYLPVSGAYPGF